MKSKVDEKNLDEEIGKIKEKLAAKVAERVASTTRNGAANNADDDFFNSVPDRVISQPTNNGARRGRGTIDVDEMDIDFDTTSPSRTATTVGKKRVVHELSEDDDFMDAPTTKKARTTTTTAAARKPPVSRSRLSSESSNPPAPPARKTPTRAAASRTKKVFPPYSLILMDRLWLKVTRRMARGIRIVLWNFQMKMMNSRLLHRQSRRMFPCVSGC